MLNRSIGVVAGILMLVANAALVARDVLPAWSAGDAPNPDGGLSLGEKHESHLEIRDREGRVIGRNWALASCTGVATTVQSWTILESIRLPNNVSTPRVRFDTELNYSNGRIDHLTFALHGLGVRTQLKGAFFPPDEFPCEWEIGEMKGGFLLGADATRVFGDEIRPFYRLPGLFVGRTWRIKVVNPLAQVLPKWGTGAFNVDAMLVRVTRRETIEHAGRPVECFRVETDHSIVWADDRGRVLKTTVTMPILGELTLEDAPYDDEARRQAVQSVRAAP